MGRFGFGIAVFAVLAILGVYTQTLNTKVSKQQGQLRDSTARLVQQRGVISELVGIVMGLKADTTTKGKTILARDNTILDMKLDNETAARKSAQAAADQQQQNQALVRTISAYNATERKAAADAEVGGVGKLNTTDSVLTQQQVASLKGQLSNANDVVIPKLRSDLAKETVRADREKDRADGAEKQVSTLETLYNDRNAVIAEKLDVLVDNKPFANIGLGKKVRKLARETRKQ